MEGNHNILNYIPHGIKLEFYHKTISSWKKSIFFVFIFLYFGQAFYFFNKNQYLVLSEEFRELSFHFIIVIISILFLLSAAYAIHIINAWIITRVFTITIGSAILLLFTSINSSEFNVSVLLLFIAFLCNIAITLIVHVIPFYIITSAYYGFNPKKHKIIKTKSKRKKGLFLRVVSPDYFFARVYKGLIKSDTYNRNSGLGGYKTIEGKSLSNIREEKNRTRYYIVFSNWLNVIFTLLIAIYLLFIEINTIAWISWYNFFFYLLLLRLLSRSIESIFAFFKDVVRNKVIYIQKAEAVDSGELLNNWRDSSIRRPERISLAAHTYIEFILLFAIYYFILIGTTVSEPYVLNQFKTFNEEYITEFSEVVEGKNDERISYASFNELVLYSLSVTFFNVSYDYPDRTPLEWKTAHVLQVLISIVLIVLSLAAYLSLPDKMYDDDTNEFLLIKYKRSKNPQHKALIYEIEKKIKKEDP